MASDRIALRAATPDDDSFVVEVLEMLPPPGAVPIIAQAADGTPVGAAWTYVGSPPLRRDAAGAPLPELCIAVASGHRGDGIGDVRQRPRA